LKLKRRQIFCLPLILSGFFCGKAHTFIGTDSIAGPGSNSKSNVYFDRPGKDPALSFAVIRALKHIEYELNQQFQLPLIDKNEDITLLFEQVFDIPLQSSPRLSVHQLLDRFENKKKSELLGLKILLLDGIVLSYAEYRALQLLVNSQP